MQMTRTIQFGSDSGGISIEDSLDIISLESLVPGTGITLASAQSNSARLQAAVDRANTLGGKTVYIPSGTYEFANAINWKSNVSLRGCFLGTNLNRHTTFTNGDLLSVVGADVNNDLVGMKFDDFRLNGGGADPTGIGGAYSTTKESDAATAGGMRIAFARDVVITNVHAYSWTRHGFRVDNCSGGFSDRQYSHPVRFTNCHAEKCWIGYYGLSSGEYVQMVNCTASCNAVDGRQDAGNWNVLGGSATGQSSVLASNYGWLVLNGVAGSGSDNSGQYANHAHGVFTGVQFNHCTSAGLITANLSLGLGVTNCTFASSQIHYDSFGVSIENAQIISAVDVYFQGGCGQFSGYGVGTGTVNFYRDLSGITDQWDVGRVYRSTMANPRVPQLLYDGGKFLTLTGATTLKRFRCDFVNLTGTAPYTVTLYATPFIGDTIIFKNSTAGTITIGRNGQNINGAAADGTLTAGQYKTYIYTSTGWETN